MQDYIAEYSYTKAGEIHHDIIRIGEHAGWPAAFAFAQSHMNRCGWKINRVTVRSAR